MNKKILKNIYKYIGVFITIYTLFGILISIFYKDYKIDAYVQNERKLSGFYLTNLVIENNGESLTSEDFLSPISLEYIIEIDSVWIHSKSNKFISAKLDLIDNKNLEINLVNLKKHERIFIKLLSKNKLSKPHIISRIKNIDNVNFHHYKIYPKLINRINFFWFFLSLIGLFIFVDMILLLSKDSKLQQIYSLINSLDENSKIDEFLNSLIQLYNNYNVRIKFVNNEIILKDFIDILNSNNSLESKQENLFLSINGSVLYFTRANFGIIGFIIFLICSLINVFNIFYYEILNWF